MRNLRGRAKMRGIHLDEDCKKAKISTHEYGQMITENFVMACMKCRAKKH